MVDLQYKIDSIIKIYGIEALLQSILSATINQKESYIQQLSLDLQTCLINYNKRYINEKT